MFRLFDRAFFRALMGFLLILAVSFSVLVLLGAYREAREGLAAFRAAFSTDDPLR